MTTKEPNALLFNIKITGYETISSRIWQSTHITDARGYIELCSSKIRIPKA